MATAAGKPNPAALERRHQGQLPTAAAPAAGQGLNAAAPFLFCVSASVGATATADRAVTQTAAPADIFDREVGDATHVRQSLRPPPPGRACAAVHVVVDQAENVARRSREMPCAVQLCGVREREIGLG